MDMDRLHNTFIPHMKERIEKGELILFTGAGFTQDIPTTVGGAVPSTGSLTRLLWRTCYGSDPLDPHSKLADLFETAQRTRGNELRQILREQFCIDAGKIPSWYTPYVQAPWYKAYTLNIDNFWDAASVGFKLRRSPRLISALEESTSAADVDLATTLPAISLNGDARNGPNKVTFSSPQYATRTANPDPWLLQFASEQLTRSIIYIGTALDEPSLWHYLELRGSKGPRGVPEHRARSYLVSPTVPRAKESALSVHHIEWIKMTAQEFAEQVMPHLEDSFAAGFEALEKRQRAEHGTRVIPLVSELINEDGGQESDYLMGSEPEWADAVSGRIASRDEDETLDSAISGELRKSREKAPIIVTGTAGSGKSSTLMKAALRLSNKGVTAGWVARNTEISAHNLTHPQPSQSLPSVIFIDAASRYGTALQSVIHTLTTSEPFPLVVAEIRSNKVDRFIDSASFGEFRPIEVVSHQLEDSDIENILDVLESEGKLGKLTGKSRQTQIEVFREKSGRELIVAMYEATTGNSFNRKMEEEYDELVGSQKDLYGAACLATYDGFELSVDELFVCCGGEMNIMLDHLDTLKRRKLIVPSRTNPGYFKARHRLIADRVFKRMRFLGTATPLIKGLLLSAATKARPDMRRGERAVRILQRFLNHDRLYSMGNLELSREVYSELQKQLEWSIDYWLQRGLLELKHGGDLQYAELFISTAAGLDESHPLVRTEVAVVKLEKALAIPGAAEAAQLFNEGAQELFDIIEEGRLRTNYPYHILGSKGLRWARTGISDDRERTAFLRQLTEKLEHGAKENTYDSKVAEIAREVKAAYLKQATTGSLG